MNRTLFLVAVAAAVLACNDAGSPEKPRCTGTFSGAVSASFQCEPAVTYHAATDTTYVAINLAASSRTGATAGAVPGYVTLAGRPTAGTYALDDARVVTAGATAPRGDVVFLAGKNAQTGQVFGRAKLVLRELVAVPGAELPEDQAYAARGSLEADLDHAISARGAERGSTHLTVGF